MLTCFCLMKCHFTLFITKMSITMIDIPVGIFSFKNEDRISIILLVSTILQILHLIMHHFIILYNTATSTCRLTILVFKWFFYLKVFCHEKNSMFYFATCSLIWQFFYVICINIGLLFFSISNCNFYKITLITIMYLIFSYPFFCVKHFK